MNTDIRRRAFLTGATLAGVGALAACTSNEEAPPAAQNAPAGAQDAPGKKVTVGFAGPQADHGWLNAITVNARAEAQRHPDVELVVAEGSNDAATQSAQIDALINRKVDVLVVLPADGKQLTPAGRKAMDAGIPVINLDRIFDSPQAYRTWVGGDNYRMGVNAGNYIGRRLNGQGTVLELAGIDTLELTRQRTQGFDDALANYPGIRKAGRAAAEFTVPTGQARMAELLQAHPQFNAIWNHDDDQGVGALQAVRQAGRTDFLMVGGAGSKAAMEQIKADDSVLKATVLYPPTMAASAVRLARLLGQSKGLTDLAEQEIPASVTTFSAVVTKENVDKYLPVSFE
ncbi:substrate-binding domain-containing protein [Amycolatopsis sp. FDAARGOS 1241]|uniref:substrate-binding domain-containing protein n=1 Tax=Amycolatopsis sp. FDAARGOS 1241 TaxID=2778070 RepID=UPI00194E86B4|nr:substrate-binding domain-containing protein [Amycolatopsis sp. FDAARGOS 1241]QRP48264.1 substrate-binding domain-containing protein [Amycolatopsis sp. FDAARGOS 1241]